MQRGNARAGRILEAILQSAEFQDSWGLERRPCTVTFGAPYLWAAWLLYQIWLHACWCHDWWAMSFRHALTYRFIKTQVTQQNWALRSHHTWRKHSRNWAILPDYLIKQHAKMQRTIYLLHWLLLLSTWKRVRWVGFLVWGFFCLFSFKCFTNKFIFFIYFISNSHLINNFSG